MKLDEIPNDHPAWEVIEPIAWALRGVVPGEIVRVRHRDGTEEQLLVGDVNGNGGYCDCCSMGAMMVIAQLDLDDLLKDVK